MKTCNREEFAPYLGSVRMRPSLEVDDTIGVRGALLCVFFHWPFLQLRHGQGGVFTQLHVRVHRGQAGCEANMLPHQPPTAAPWNEQNHCNICTIRNVLNCIYLSHNFVYGLAEHGRSKSWFSKAKQLYRGTEWMRWLLLFTHLNDLNFNTSKCLIFLCCHCQLHNVSCKNRKPGRLSKW